MLRQRQAGIGHGEPWAMIDGDGMDGRLHCTARHSCVHCDAHGIQCRVLSALTPVLGASMQTQYCAAGVGHREMSSWLEIPGPCLFRIWIDRSIHAFMRLNHQSTCILLPSKVYPTTSLSLLFSCSNTAAAAAAANRWTDRPVGDESWRVNHSTSELGCMYRAN